jgi:hypothetical protein
VWEGEDDVEVRNRQDLAAAGGEPALGGHALAFWGSGDCDRSCR